VLSGEPIPPGQNQGQFTVSSSAVRGWMPGPMPLQIVGHAAGSPGTTQKIDRFAQPADDLMQAFLWRHLMPAQETLVAPPGGTGRGRTFEAEHPAPDPMAVRASDGGGSAGAGTLVETPPRMPRAGDPTRTLARPHAAVMEGEVVFEEIIDADAPPVGLSNELLTGTQDREAVRRRRGARAESGRNGEEPSP
jgi:hypothetical protein